MHAFDILGDPVRRRLLELLAQGESPAGELGRVIQEEFGISQPAVSQHLRVLRDAGFASVRPEGTRRVYALLPGPLAAADEWFDAFRRFWQPHLDALGTELARGRRRRRLDQERAPRHPSIGSEDERVESDRPPPDTTGKPPDTPDKEEE